MRRERALQIVLVITGLIFLASSYPLTLFFSREPALAMMLIIYVTLGVFLLLAARNPSAHRSLIAFTAWSSLAHASLMVVQVLRNLIQRQELVGVFVFFVIGIVLIVLSPGKPKERAAVAA
jgi:hypothetical protein